MKVLQSKWFYFYNKSAKPKTILSLIIILFCFFNLSAQNESNIKLKIETGINWKPSEKNIDLGGGMFSLGINLKTSKNTFIGLRIQVTENYQDNEKYKSSQFFIDNNIRADLYGATAGTQISFVSTFDYYFNKKSIRPYLGVGVGYYMLAALPKISQKWTPFGLLETRADNQIGILIKGGLDIRKFSVGLEFNFIPKADIKIPNGLIIGTVNDSFIVLTIGYSIGIRKKSSQL